MTAVARKVWGEENQSANNFRCKMDWQFARNKDGAVVGKANGNYREGLEGKDRDSAVKKRKTECKNEEKGVEKIGTVNEQKHEDLGASKGKVYNLVRLDYLNNEQKSTSDIRKMENFHPNSSLHEEQTPSVPSSGYEGNRSYLKQPHPDTKYLSRVHRVPSTHDLSEYIDQSWLFPADHGRRKTARLEDAEPRQVWSDAQLIDAADVVAMPYVVPL
uniref:Uncharacterized protein n=1 Tax=Zea mays TaxID=4577 RepID=A0A804LTW2_MAIZE